MCLSLRVPSTVVIPSLFSVWRWPICWSAKRIGHVQHWYLRGQPALPCHTIHRCVVRPFSYSPPQAQSSTSPRWDYWRFQRTNLPRGREIGNRDLPSDHLGQANTTSNLRPFEAAVGHCCSTRCESGRTVTPTRRGWRRRVAASSPRRQAGHRHLRGQK